MTVYYHDPAVEVTSAGIRVDGHFYRFEELARIWHQRAARSWGAVAGRGAWSMTLAAPLALAVIAMAVAVQLDVSFGVRAMIVLAAVLVGLGAALLLDPVLDKLDTSFDRGTHTYEIWAMHNGVEVRLLQTRNASRFGRIYRALQRASES